MLVKEQDKIGNILKKGNLILIGAYGLLIPINDKKLIEVTSSSFGNVSTIFKWYRKKIPDTHKLHTVTLIIIDAKFNSKYTKLSTWNFMSCLDG